MLLKLILFTQSLVVSIRQDVAEGELSANKIMNDWIFRQNDSNNVSDVTSFLYKICYFFENFNNLIIRMEF